MIISTKCTKHIQISQVYQNTAQRDAAIPYQAPARSPPWPCIGSCGLLSEIQDMPAFKAYRDYLSDGSGNPSLTEEFADCCAKLIRELCEEYQGKLVEGYAHFFSEQLFEAVQKLIQAETNYEALLQLYISLGDGKEAVHDGPIRQACLRQLYVAHVEGLLCYCGPAEKNTMVAVRRAACRLRTGTPTLSDKLVQDAGACPMIPPTVRQTLRKKPFEWEEKMKKFGMDVRQLILSTLGKDNDKAKEEPIVVSACENFKKGLREAPGDSIWTEKATRDFFQWLEAIHQERAEEIRHTVFGLFVGDGGTCGSLFLNEHTLHKGMTVDRALHLLLVWALLLLDTPPLSREGFQNYVQALFNLSAADKRSLGELRRTESQPSPLWSLVGVLLASRATLDELERARTQLLQIMYKSPGSKTPMDAQRFFLSFLSTAEWCRWNGLLTNALEKVCKLDQLETCLCKYVSPDKNWLDLKNISEQWKQDEVAVQKIMQILMDGEKLFIPSPEDCGKCNEKLEKPVQKAYKMVEKLGNEAQREVAKQLNLKEGELSEKTFVEAARNRLRLSMRVSRFLHLHEKLIKIHEEQCQQPEIVDYAHPKPLRDDLRKKLRDFEQAQQAQPPRPMALEELLSLCDGLRPFLLTRTSPS
ncbi:unnamed protein product [Trypanosoma congolense IL3000]|uniref:WGS project CAEQ00000000 data, annotated contig 98 n=1 Tax=Trypanosoma congolense (strain IL3000) TaxID=1068625 RepID=F9WK53_TRYCI|nr:unnamed protein product [Trypanosoma congolense IL3000]